MRTLGSLALLLLSTALGAVELPVPEPPPVEGLSYVLYDFDTGQVLAGRDETKPLEPASITKVMTAYVIFSEIKAGHVKWDDLVTISKNAWKRGDESRMFVEVGKQVSVNDLVHGIIIQSGNDASVAMAEHLGGTEEAFATLMEAYGKRLGLTHTQFRNAAGMPDPEHYSSALDIALISAATIREFPEEYKIYSQKEFTFNNIRQYNRNKLLYREAAVDGIKTGYTAAAGYCLAASMVRDGRRLISVIMGAKTESTRARDSLALLNWGYRFFEPVVFHKPGDTVTTVRTWKGAERDVALTVARPLAVSVPRGKRDLVKTAQTVESQVIAPVAAGQPLGNVVITLNGKTLRSERLIAAKEIPRGGFFTRAMDHVVLWWKNR